MNSKKVFPLKKYYNELYYLNDLCNILNKLYYIKNIFLNIFNIFLEFNLSFGYNQTVNIKLNIFIGFWSEHYERKQPNGGKIEKSY